jgi:hypothetical protein
MIELKLLNIKHPAVIWKYSNLVIWYFPQPHVHRLPNVLLNVIGMLGSALVGNLFRSKIVSYFNFLNYSETCTSNGLRISPRSYVTLEKKTLYTIHHHKLIQC